MWCLNNRKVENHLNHCEYYNIEIECREREGEMNWENHNFRQIEGS